MTDSHTAGADALVVWLNGDPKARTKRSVALALGVTASAVGQWAAGKVAPGYVYRRALRILTGIPEEAWVTEAERETLQRANDGAAQVVAALAAESSASLPASDDASTSDDSAA